MKETSKLGLLLKMSSNNPLITLSNLPESGTIFLTLKCQMQYLKASNNNSVGLLTSWFINPYQ